MNANTIVGFIAGSAGAFLIVSSLLNLEYLRKGKRAEFYRGILGATGTRIFYVALGGFLIYIASELMRTAG